MVGLVFALGLLVGLLIGIVVRDALDLLSVTVPSGRPLVHRFTHWVTRNVLPIALVLVVFVNFALGVLLIQQRAQTARYASCTAGWQAAFSESYRARAAAAEEVSAAMDRIVNAVVSGDESRIQLALSNYVKVREQQNRRRVANPPPQPPGLLCGDPTR